MNLAETLELYAGMYSPAQASIERYVLHHGREYEPGVLADELGPPRQCFLTAQQTAIWSMWEGPPVTYVEGFAWSALLPGLVIAHGWVVDEHDRVIETTWPDVGAAYYGVAIPDLADRLLARETFGPFLDAIAYYDHKQQTRSDNSEGANQ